MHPHEVAPDGLLVVFDVPLAAFGLVRHEVVLDDFDGTLHLPVHLLNVFLDGGGICLRDPHGRGLSITCSSVSAFGEVLQRDP